MAANPVGRLAGEVDDLLVEQRRLADQRNGQALLAGLAQEAGALLLVSVDEDRVGVGALHLDHVGGEVSLADSVEMSAATSMPRALNSFRMASRPPLPKSLLT